MNDIVDDNNHYRRSLYAESSVWVGHQRDAPFPRPQPLITPHVCDWMQMIIIDGQLWPWKYTSSQAQREKKLKMKRKPVCHFQVGYIHNQRRIKIIYFYFVVIKTDLSQQQPLKWLKMHYIKTMRQPSWKKHNIEPSHTILTPSQMPLQTINF